MVDAPYHKQNLPCNIYILSLLILLNIKEKDTEKEVDVLLLPCRWERHPFQSANLCRLMNVFCVGALDRILIGMRE